MLPMKPIEAPDTDSPTVLVIDDVSDNRVVICRRLMKLGFTARSADSGRNGLAAIYASRPDVVLLDYMMPDLTGLAVLRELRSNGLFADLPVIMLTARTDPGTVVAVLDAGANDYVSKPIDFSVLKARIEKQLTDSRSTRALEHARQSLDRRQITVALENRELREELTAEIAYRTRLEEQLTALGSRTVSLDGIPVDRSRIAKRLRRMEELIERLTAQAGEPNPAILLEIGAQLRGTLKELGL